MSEISQRLGVGRENVHGWMLEAAEKDKPWKPCTKAQEGEPYPTRITDTLKNHGARAAARRRSGKITTTPQRRIQPQVCPHCDKRTAMDPCWNCKTLLDGRPLPTP